ncbi:MAG: class I SAM-dependent methyltransferase [Actinomycetota bacterium]|nr:class I SAM-dependent methyltransferase [Actinomycetota bacterium]
MSGGADLAARVAATRWYHTIDLGGGVVTPGWFDTRATLAKVPLPASLSGLRCLDVGTWDGFWAFEMERRGAASVTAIDIDDQERWDWPPAMRVARAAEDSRRYVEDFKAGSAGFALAREALGSWVERLDLSVHDLSPQRVGTFDLVFLGSLLLHLRDPVGALDAVRSVCAGEAVIADAVDAIPSFTRPRTPTARLEGIERPWWWQPNRTGLHQMVRSAGFEILEATGVYVLPRGVAHPPIEWRELLREAGTAAGREQLIVAWKGLPHAAVRARPRI